MPFPRQVGIKKRAFRSIGTCREKQRLPNMGSVLEFTIVLKSVRYMRGVHHYCLNQDSEDLRIFRIETGKWNGTILGRDRVHLAPNTRYVVRLFLAH